MFGHFNPKKFQGNLTLILICTLSTASTLAIFADDQVLPERVLNTQEEQHSYLTFYYENDLFNGEDANYTSGGRLSYITPGQPAVDIAFIQHTLDFLSGGEDSSELMKKIWGLGDRSKVRYSYGFALTQQMFTPENKFSAEPDPGDRPYVGWLGLGFSVHARDHRTLNSVEISLGTVGPHAFAEDTQDYIHDIRDLDKFQGWDSQMPNEPTLNIVFNQKRRWHLLEDANLPMNLEIDGFHETGVSLGNFLTDIHVGGLIRIGWNLPVEFSDARLTQTAHTQRLFSNGESGGERWSGYAILGARGSAVFHDITIDGPVFRSYDTNIKREPLIGEAYIGFGVRRGNWEFGYVHTYRSKQFESQGDPQGFGSVAIRKQF